MNNIIKFIDDKHYAGAFRKEDSCETGKEKNSCNSCMPPQSRRKINHCASCHSGSYLKRGFCVPLENIFGNRDFFCIVISHHDSLEWEFSF